MLEVRQVVNGEAQTSDAATYRYRLPNAGSLHSLLLRCSMTNGATSGRGVDIFDVVDDIRIVADGSTILYQLHPVELEKVRELLTGKPLEVNQIEGAAGVQQGVFPILFGRELVDLEMWLPLGSFNVVNLEVDYSPTISATVGFATGTFTVDLLTVITPAADSLSYRGTLVTRRVKEVTTVASGVDATEIYRKFPLRFIGVYCYEANTEDAVDVTRVELSANSGAKSIMAFDWPEFLTFNSEYFGHKSVRHDARLFAKDNDTIDMRLGRVSHYNVEINEAEEIGTDTQIVYRVDAITGDRMTLAGSLHTTTTTTTPIAADSASRDLYLTVEGLSPSFFGVFPYMLPDAPEGYMDPTRLDKLEVYNTQGGAGGTLSIITQELQTF